MIFTKLPTFYHFFPSFHVTLFLLFIISFSCLLSISCTNSVSQTFLKHFSTKRADDDTELDALLTWKASLDIQSQHILASWHPTHPPCRGNWSGISCNKARRVDKIDLSSYGLGDFGTARFLRHDSSYWTSFAGTFGYSAPELAYTREISVKCDVYSFGVLTLEVMMGTHPVDLISMTISSSLSSSNPSLSILLKNVIDQRISHPVKDEIEKVILIMKLAFACLQQNPQSRPTMRDVSIQLAKMKTNNTGVDFSSIKISELLDT